MFWGEFMISDESLKIIDSCLSNSLNRLSFELRDVLSDAKHHKDCLKEDDRETDPRNKYSEEDRETIKELIVECARRSKKIAKEMSEVAQAYKEFKLEFKGKV